MPEIQLMPPSPSSIAPEIDRVYYALVIVGGAVATAIAILLIILAVRYRRGSKADRGPDKFKGWRLEATWIIIPLCIFLTLFVWSALVYFKVYTPPADTLDV